MILDKLLELGKSLVSIMHRLQKLEEGQKELREELRETKAGQNRMREEMRDLVLVVERMVHTVSRERDRAESERKILQLEIENRLLRMERGLPSGSAVDDDPGRDP